MTKLVEYAPSLAHRHGRDRAFRICRCAHAGSLLFGKGRLSRSEIECLVYSLPSSKPRYPMRSHIRLRHCRRPFNHLSPLVGCKWPARIQGIQSRIQRAFRTDNPLVDVLSGVRRRLKAAAYMMLTLKGI
jgi:hypothetical protein